MFTRNAIFLFLYLHPNILEAAVPIQIITEKTNLEILEPESPHIIAMIPNKEPLITAARKTNIDVKNPQEKHLSELVKSHHNTSEIKQEELLNRTKLLPSKENSNSAEELVSENSRKPSQYLLGNSRTTTKRTKKKTRWLP